MVTKICSRNYKYVVLLFILKSNENIFIKPTEDQGLFGVLKTVNTANTHSIRTGILIASIFVNYDKYKLNLIITSNNMYKYHRDKSKTMSVHTTNSWNHTITK